jgi:hypothetical protein
MKKKILTIVGIAIAVAIIIPIALCVGHTELANDSTHLDWAVRTNMDIEEVYNLMSPELKKQVMSLPAMAIEEKSEGRWEFAPKDNASPGDTNAPYIVLAVYPDSNEEGFLMLFFKNEKLMDRVWFDSDAGWDIIDKLWTAQEE